MDKHQTDFVAKIREISPELATWCEMEFALGETLKDVRERLARCARQVKREAA